MAIATVEPNYFTAGNSVYWDKLISDYPASSYLLTYSLIPVAGGESFTFAASASVSTHQVRLTPAQTSAYNAGDYRLIGTLTDISTSGITTKISLDPLRVSVRPQATSTADRRTFAEITLQNLQDTYAKLSKNTLTSATINGRTYNKNKLLELREEIIYWRNQVRSESSSTGAVKQIAIQFNTPS